MAKKDNQNLRKGGRCLRRCISKKYKYERYIRENRCTKNKARRIAKRIRNYKDCTGFLRGLNHELLLEVKKHINSN